MTDVDSEVIGVIKYPELVFEFAASTSILILSIVVDAGIHSCVSN